MLPGPPCSYISLSYLITLDLRHNVSTWLVLPATSEEQAKPQRGPSGCGTAPEDTRRLDKIEGNRESLQKTVWNSRFLRISPASYPPVGPCFSAIFWCPFDILHVWIQRFVASQAIFTTRWCSHAPTDAMFVGGSQGHTVDGYEMHLAPNLRNPTTTITDRPPLGGVVGMSWFLCKCSNTRYGFNDHGFKAVRNEFRPSTVGVLFSSLSDTPQKDRRSSEVACWSSWVWAPPAPQSWAVGASGRLGRFAVTSARQVFWVGHPKEQRLPTMGHADFFETRVTR